MPLEKRLEYIVEEIRRRVPENCEITVEESSTLFVTNVKLEWVAVSNVPLVWRLNVSSEYETYQRYYDTILVPVREAFSDMLTTKLGWPRNLKR
jgi:hypothetical protein